MPGGRRNPFSVTRIVEAVQHVKSDAHEATAMAKSFAQAKMGEIPFIDVEIQFIGASGLPKLDVVGSADPYFVAKIDNKISFVSAVKANTLAPVWNELWKVKNVPASSDLHVELLDKDDGAPHDDFIGKFKTTLSSGAKEAEIEGPIFRRSRGTFWLKISSHPSEDTNPAEFPYLFDGPIRFSRHFSPTIGRLTNLNDARLYSTWKIFLRGIPLFFGEHYQGWNQHYKAAQSIFQGPTSIAVRSGIQTGHRMLYARNVNNVFGVIDAFADISEILHGGVGGPAGAQSTRGAKFAHRIKPSVYTYVISSEDNSLRFSETGAAFFVDFASKHALHSNCAESVRYSGEFHPRPKGGWAAFSDDIQDNEVDWELVIDNNSGTYAPDKTLLPALQKLLEYNFPGFGIFAWDREDPKLVESREACREYALKFREVTQNELQPHAAEGEETLSHHVSAGVV